MAGATVSWADCEDELVVPGASGLVARLGHLLLNVTHHKQSIPWICMWLVSCPSMLHRVAATSITSITLAEVQCLSKPFHLFIDYAVCDFCCL